MLPSRTWAKFTRPDEQLMGEFGIARAVDDVVDPNPALPMVQILSQGACVGRTSHVRPRRPTSDIVPPRGWNLAIQGNPASSARASSPAAPVTARSSITTYRRWR